MELKIYFIYKQEPKITKPHKRCPKFCLIPAKNKAKKLNLATVKEKSPLPKLFQTLSE
jgi:hypothetical protein